MGRQSTTGFKRLMFWATAIAAVLLVAAGVAWWSLTRDRGAPEPEQPCPSEEAVAPPPSAVFEHDDALPHTPLPSLEDVLPRELDREHVGAAAVVPVHPWQAKRVKNIRDETIEESIHNLANFDDMSLAETSFSGLAVMHGSAEVEVILVTRLARVRRLMEEGRREPGSVIPPLRRAFCVAVDAWPDVWRKRLAAFNAAAAAGTGHGQSEPNMYDRLRAQALVATYVLAELGDHQALPVMLKCYKHHDHNCPPKLRSPIGPGLTLYAMHRLVSSYPVQKLNDRARRLREAYLKTARCLPPCRQIAVTKWQAKYDETDPRLLKIPRQKGSLLRAEPNMKMVLYPARFTDGSYTSDPNGTVSKKARELFRQLEEFVVAAFPDPKAPK